MFIIIFFSFSFIFFIIYLTILYDEKTGIFELFKFSIYQSYGFSVDSIDTKQYNFEYLSFFQKILSLIINLIFTSALVLKYFSKPTFFKFKEKVNICDDYLIISLYNKSDFEINSCNFTVYVRLPFKDSHGMNSLNNIRLYPDKEFFPFMDKHLVTRLRVNLNDSKNSIVKSGNDLHKGLFELLNKPDCDIEKNEVQNLRISIMIQAISPEMDNSIYETYTYEVNICDPESINGSINFKGPNSIDIDMVDFTKSKGWENFED